MNEQEDFEKDVSYIKGYNQAKKEDKIKLSNLSLEINKLIKKQIEEI